VRGITAGKRDGGWGMIGFDATRLSEQWDLLTKWLLLEWDRIQTLPYGPSVPPGWELMRSRVGSAGPPVDLS
jgi:hypothetical protein